MTPSMQKDDTKINSSLYLKFELINFVNTTIVLYRIIYYPITYNFCHNYIVRYYCYRVVYNILTIKRRDLWGLGIKKYEQEPTVHQETPDFPIGQFITGRLNRRSSDADNNNNDNADTDNAVDGDRTDGHSRIEARGPRAC